MYGLHWVHKCVCVRMCSCIKLFYVCVCICMYVPGVEDRSAQDFDFLFSHIAAGCGAEASYSERGGRRVYLRQGHQVRMNGLMNACYSIFKWFCENGGRK